MKPKVIEGARCAGDEGRASHLCHAVDTDPTLLGILDQEPGPRARRRPWRR
ncbi:hypothetical protein [Asanoa sp. NPDC050611]|uniref:hypothetical protein n=1 Tax=Asanoa sp. NPDC050611 TaxID=3157098 RepID=UPI0033FBCD50